MRTLYIAALSILTIPVFAQPGTLDPTFGTGGIVTTSINAGDDRINDIAIQSDGMIVVAGLTYGSSTVNDVSVARYNTDGSLDATFGTAGTAVFDVLGASRTNYAADIALQSDGKIVLGGMHDDSNTDDDFLIMRLLTDGSKDASFGTAGEVFADFTGYEEVTQVLVQPDGKILAVGITDNPQIAVAMFRVSANGTPDATFGTGAKVVSNSPGGEDRAACAILQSDGKIIVGGQTWVGSTWDFSLSRYNTDGTIDNSFGTSGWVIQTLGSDDDQVTGLAIQPDGKIIAGGYLWNGTSHDFTMMRFNADGTVDNSFGTSGQVTTPIGLGCEFVEDIVLQPDGKVIAAGYFWNGTDNDVAVLKYNANGTLDTTFGTAGMAKTDVNTEEDIVTCMDMQADGKIVVGGFTATGSNDDFILMRYRNDVASDVSSEVLGAQLRLTPNPASGVVVVSSDLDMDAISVLTVTGAVVLHVSPLGSEVAIPLNDLPAGIYFVRVENSSGNGLSKLIVE